MLRKALTLGTVFILALSLLAVSMITCFTYDSEADAGAHGHFDCKHRVTGVTVTFHTHPGDPPWDCIFKDAEHVTGE
ncbi:hypothetical protein C6502_08025 [Candidatus Poribacteria bacterium]|nr:MAG: hypothetical protein C6502_08025 [Candidatus Poribacteria bacterium]